jgi:hypothetical protein
MITPVVVGGVVSSPPDGMEEVQDVAVESPLHAETAQQIGLFLVGRCERASPGSHLLCQDLSELPQPDQADDRVIGKVTLRERTQPRELTMSKCQEAKVGTCGDGRHGGYGPFSLDRAQT